MSSQMPKTSKPPMRERKYRKPPIVEVVCEFRFKPSTPWDATMPGLIYEQLKKEFPKRRALRNVGMHVQVEQKGVLFQPQMEEGTQFLREDEWAFVQLQPRRISVHHLAPYPHWEGFKPLIEKAYKAYLEVVPDPAIQRIGLRYINKIDFNTTEVDLPTFFNFYPYVGRELPQQYTAFNLQLLFPHAKGRDGLQMRLSNAPPERENAVSILLDLDYFLVQSENINFEQGLEWVENAHKNILAAFEGAITEQLRQQFEEEK
ncbi:MAG: TIGR04255 family protein [Calditrichaeota bacterium]|nr:MAG: TIGR04255 family protein [Calditrichota bacterium]